MRKQQSDTPDPPSLAISGARGGSLVLIGSGASLALQFISLASLSRLLEPSDFGLIAMVSVFVTLGSLLRDFGLPMAGLQVRALSQQQASNLFWMNVTVAGLSGLALASATPALVALFDEPRLAAIVPSLALVVVIGGVTAQIQVNLARRMRYRSLVVSDVVAQTVALSVAVGLAASGFGYWALVWQSIIAACITLAYRWIASAWVPSRPRTGHGAAAMFRVGADYGVAQLLTFLQSNLATIVIGAQFGATHLGYYNRAYQMLTAPASRVLDPLTHVVVTTLNRARSAGQDAQRLLLQVQFGVGSLIVWIFAITAAVAPALLPAVLGDQWSPSVPVFQVLAIGGCVWVFNHVSYWAFIAFEKSRALLHYNLVSKPLAIVSLLIGTQFGVVGAAWGYTVAMIFSWPLNLAWLSRTSDLRARPFLANGLRILLAGAMGAAASWGAFTVVTPVGPLLAIAAGFSAGTLGMVAVIFASPRLRAMSFSWLQFSRSVLTRRRLVRTVASD